MVKQKGSGWHNESRRHSLARRGIKTAQKIPVMYIKKSEDPNYIRVFSFSDLPKDVQEKVIEKQRQTEMENYGNVEMVTEDMTEYLEDMGVFDKENLFWDASQSQGDYVSFDTKDVDWEMFMKFHKFNKEDIAFIKKLDSKDKLSMGYKDGEIWFDEDDLTDKETGKLRNIAISLENKFRDVKRTLLKNAYSYYDSIQEEDYLKETIEANDYKFLADGRMV